MSEAVHLRLIALLVERGIARVHREQGMGNFEFARAYFGAGAVGVPSEFPFQGLESRELLTEIGDF